MIRQQERSITRTIGEIKDMLDVIKSRRDDVDTLKTAVEIYNLSKGDTEIADNMRDYWMHQADRAEK